MKYFTLTLIKLMLFFNIIVSLSYTQSIRKNYNEMTTDEKAAYVDAIYELHTGIIIELADYHNNNFNLIHFNFDDNDVFLAWHRRAILEMEEAIKATNENLTLSIPYWNWVTDNSANDPLWDQDFLGQFDDDEVFEVLGRWFSGSLPTQTDVNNVQTVTNWNDYTFGLETSPVHFDPHNWVGSIMSGRRSPLDPVFYMHHGMIDKLWQEWEDINQASSYAVTSLPRYGINPNTIVDSRSLNVWYAENEIVMLDDYQTNGTNNYSDTGKIESEDFTVATGSNVTFTAGTEILLGAGFQVQSGSTFFAEVDPNVGTLTKTRFAEEKNKNEKEIPNSFSLLQNYPNPFNPSTIIKYTLPVDAHVTVKVYDILGKEITEPVNEFKSAGEYSVDFNGSSLASGIYFYYIIASPAGGQENFKQVKKMILAK